MTIIEHELERLWPITGGIMTMALTKRIFFDFHQGFEKVRLVLVRCVYDSRAHWHKLIDYSGVGRVQIASDDVGQFEVVKHIVLLGEPVPLVRATIDGQPKQSWNTSDRCTVRQCVIEVYGCFYGSVEVGVQHKLTFIPKPAHQHGRVFDAGIEYDHSRTIQAHVVQGRPPVPRNAVGQHGVHPAESRENWKRIKRWRSVPYPVGCRHSFGTDVICGFDYTCEHNHGRCTWWH